MACNSDFVQYIIDQCSGAGEIAVRKMMGDYCIYCDGVLFGLICDNNFYVKVTEPGRAVLKEVILRPPYEGAKDYFYISDVDDREYLTSLIKASVLGGRYTNASEVIRAGLRRLEEDEQKIAALRAAIEEGEASGYVEDFDFESHLEELKAKRRSNG